MSNLKVKENWYDDDELQFEVPNISSCIVSLNSHFIPITPLNDCEKFYSFKKEEPETNMEKETKNEYEYHADENNGSDADADVNNDYGDEDYYDDEYDDECEQMDKKMGNHIMF